MDYDTLLEYAGIDGFTPGILFIIIVSNYLGI